MNVRETEVAIVGGGMVGMTLAIALRRAGIDVAVIDRATPEQVLAPEYDGRASAIAYASVRLLEATGIWAEVAETQPILDIRVSDGDSLLFLHYDHRAMGGAPLGQMVENRHLRLAQARAAAREQVAFVAGSLATLRRGPGAVEIGLKGGGAVHARLAVGADGARSTVRDLAGIGTAGWAYDQTGIVLTVRHERPHGGVAHERFLPAGPFAILPLAGNRSSLVWTERSDLAAAVLELPEGRFRQELAARFGDFLGKLTPLGPRWSYPLGLHQADRYVGDRLALIGDAAHRMHPIAGQGLNLGLRDAAALAEVIVDAARLGLDIGGAQALERYQRWRRFDSIALLAVTDVLNRLFSNSLPPVRLARDAGLAIVNRMPPLKRILVGHARGTAGKLPRLLAGEAL
ncbi:MAG: FAD-dependent monooxygenase [Proteobacteria bacterium]|nr:FAD-dependent monooxygenase [Pseudomonadota bacterium]